MRSDLVRRACTWSERGGALVETALVLPLMLLLIFGMIWFGLLTYTHIVVQIAAAQGARVAAAAYADDPLGVKTPSPREKAVGFVRSVIQNGLNLSDLDAIELTQESIAGEAAVKVGVAYRFTLLVPFLQEWAAGPAASGIRVVRASVYRIEVGP